MAEKSLDEQVLLFKDALQVFINTAESIPEALRTHSGALGDWSAREVIAHINGWMVECTRRLPRFSKGTGNIEYNIDTFNAVSVWLRENQDYEMLLDENRRLTNEIVEFCENLNDFYKNKDERYGEWLNILIHEAETHGEDLRQFMTANSD